MTDGGRQGTGPEKETPPSIGMTIRAAREARGLTVEAIARSLRLNPRYVTALERDDYGAFPASPYVRVYLRAVAQHVGIDPDQAIAAYLRQTAQGDDERGRESEREMVRKSPPVGQHGISWWAVIFLALVLVGMAVVARRMNQHRTALSSVPAPVQAIDTGAAAPDSLRESATPSEDSLSGAPDTMSGTAAAVSPPSRDSLVLVVAAARKDSVWVQVFSDGKSWKGILQSGSSRIFRATDSLNVHVGHNAALTYTLNGTPFQPSDNKGVAVFKVTRQGVKEWSLERWKTVFEGRL